MVLDDLSKKDKNWRSIALKICGDESDADDLVQEMYLKVCNYKKVSVSCVYTVMMNSFIDSIKNKKEVSIAEHEYLQCQNRTFEPDDYEKEILEKYQGLTWTQRELIIESHDRSLREIEKVFPMINYGFAHRQITKGIKTILGDDFERLHNNTRLKFKRA